MENLARIEGYKQASTLFADCTSSNGGMFAGILSVIAVTITCVVLLTMGDCDYDLNQNISNSMRIVVFAILIATSAYCYYIVACLEVNPHPISLLDDMLLFFCMPAFFLYGIVSWNHRSGRRHRRHELDVDEVRGSQSYADLICSG